MNRDYRTPIEAYISNICSIFSLGVLHSQRVMPGIYYEYVQDWA